MYSETASIQEMRDVLHEIADITTPSKRWKARVTAAAKAAGLPWSRAKDLYYQNAHTVKDHEGRAARAALREIKAKRQAYEQHQSIHQTLAYMRQTDPDFHSPSIDRLEHSFSRLGILGGTLDEPE